MRKDIKLIEWIEKVILSCETIEQLINSDMLIFNYWMRTKDAEGMMYLRNVYSNQWNFLMLD